MTLLLRSFLHDRFMHLLVVLGLMLASFVPFNVVELPQAVNWPTMTALCGLLILTKGIEASGYFDVLGGQLVQRFRHQRQLALFFVCAAALLSTFLTNDVALFILVPLTLSLRQYSSLPLSKLIIFEALAVNAGSLLTPIGNPQNILLWRQSGRGFIEFIGQMLPLAALLFTGLLLLTVFCFPAHRIDRLADRPEQKWQRPLLFASMVLYILFIAALELGFAAWGLAVVFLTFLLIARRVLIAIDWSLLVVFVAMFIDVYLLTRLPLLQSCLHTAAQLPDLQQFLLAVGLSQIISNVPTTILLLTTLPASTLLVWAVNIGGFGLFPGSLANVIALRMAKDRQIWWQFHLYSMPMLLWALLGGWLLYLTFCAT